MPANSRERKSQIFGLNKRSSEHSRTIANPSSRFSRGATKLPRLLAELLEAHQPGPDGVERRLCAALDTELSQDGRDVGLDRLLFDKELAGYLLVGLAERQEPQDLALTLG